MLTSIAGRSVIVTGASKGIGKGIARVFCQNGGKVLVVSRNPEGAEVCAEELRRAGSIVVHQRVPRVTRLPTRYTYWRRYGPSRVRRGPALVRRSAVVRVGGEVQAAPVPERARRIRLRRRS